VESVRGQPSGLGRARSRRDGVARLLRPRRGGATPRGVGRVGASHPRGAIGSRASAPHTKEDASDRHPNGARQFRTGTTCCQARPPLRARASHVAKQSASRLDQQRTRPVQRSGGRPPSGWPLAFILQPSRIHPCFAMFRRGVRARQELNPRTRGLAKVGHGPAVSGVSSRSGVLVGGETESVGRPTLSVGRVGALLESAPRHGGGKRPAGKGAVTPRHEPRNSYTLTWDQ